jgi:hypothetical protein
MVWKTLALVDGAVALQVDFAVPGADVAPEEGKGRPVRAGVRQLAAQQPVLHGVGVEGDAGSVRVCSGRSIVSKEKKVEIAPLYRAIRHPFTPHPE